MTCCAVKHGVLLDAPVLLLHAIKPAAKAAQLRAVDAQDFGLVVDVAGASGVEVCLLSGRQWGGPLALDLDAIAQAVDMRLEYPKGWARAVDWLR